MTTPKKTYRLPPLTVGQLAALAVRDSPGRPNQTATLCRIIATAYRAEGSPPIPDEPVEEDAPRPSPPALPERARVEPRVPPGGLGHREVPRSFTNCPRCGGRGKPSEARKGALACVQLHRWNPATGVLLEIEEVLK